MDENCDLSQPFSAYMADRSDVIKTFIRVKKILDDDLIFIGKIILVAILTIIQWTLKIPRFTWNIIAGVFVTLLLSILWIFGEL